MILNRDQQKAVLHLISQALVHIRAEALSSENPNITKIRNLADAFAEYPELVVGDFPAEQFANSLLHADRDLAQKARIALDLPLLKW